MKRAKKKKYSRYSTRRKFAIEYVTENEHGFWDIHCAKMNALLAASDIELGKEHTQPEWSAMRSRCTGESTLRSNSWLVAGELTRPVRNMGLPAGTKIMLYR